MHKLCFVVLNGIFGGVISAVIIGAVIGIFIYQLEEWIRIKYSSKKELENAT